MNTEETNSSEISSLSQPPLPNYHLKWKSKPILLIYLFNFLMVCILAALAITIASYGENTKKVVVLCLGGILFTCFGLLIWSMHKLLKEHKDHSEIIKPTRLKYFRAGTSCSFASSLFTLISLFVAYLIADNTAVKIVAFTFVGVCIILGTISIIFSSMYGFCSAFDIYYHKNRVELVKNYLIRQGITDKEIKMNDGEEIDEG